VTGSSPSVLSFRDPSGCVFVEEGVIYRRVTAAGEPDYQHLMKSGLYGALVADGLLIEHEDLGERQQPDGARVRVLRPTPVPFISYPYEWCFSQLQDAARVTLAVMERALLYGMALKDASATNVQFVGSRPVFVDTLSFERVRPGPWAAYRQFCQHFLAPLALVALTDARLNALGLAFPDGLPLDLASRLLPRSTLMRLRLLVHVHLHAAAERRLSGNRFAARWAARRGEQAGTAPLQALVAHLRKSVERLKWRPRSAWTDYEDRQSSYTADELARKERLVREWLDRANPRVVWDLGANTGRYSHLAAERAVVTVAIDADMACIERLYRRVRHEQRSRVLPLVMDVTQPTPGRGWANRERASLEERGPADVVLALAFVHHVSITGNVPLPLVAEFLSRVGRGLVIEFVPRTDPAVLDLAPLLDRRPDVAAWYSPEGFERAFGAFFRTVAKVPITETGRVLYWMARA
jgi:hypothetical protein